MPPPADEDDLDKVRRLTGLTPLDARCLSVKVAVQGACAPLAGLGPRPCLVFQFTTADQTELLPIVLVLDDPSACQLADLVHDQIHVAKAKTDSFRRLS